MILSGILLATMSLPQVSVDIIDSRDDNRFVFVIVNQKCKIEIGKQELKDYDLVVRKVMNLCGVSLDSL